MSYPEKWLQSLKDRSDIVAVVKKYPGLKLKAIKREGKVLEYRALCPFHQEKTPSFFVVHNKQFFHCFGCGAHGGVFTFITRYEGLTHVAAIRKVARMYGMRLPYKQKEKLKA